MSAYQPENPLIVQGDHTVLAEVDSPRYIEARDHLARFAELIKSPEHIHTYRISPLSIWNAAAAGVDPDEIVETLHQFSKYEVPQHVAVEIRDYASRYGRLRLTRAADHLVLTANDRPLAEEISRLTQAVRDRTITASELQGGTATITNYGSLGGRFATPIIKAPEVLIVGFGAIKPRPFVVNGELAATPTLPISIAVDHRLIDGDVMTAFQEYVIEQLSDPVSLLAR